LYRSELEDQAKKAFAAVRSADFQAVIYKNNQDDWRRAEIVVTTVQSLLFNNSTPTAPSAASTASRPSATPCSMA
jgi:superfamily II DNA or RNA helicase